MRKARKKLTITDRTACIGAKLFVWADEQRLTFQSVGCPGPSMPIKQVRKLRDYLTLWLRTK